MIEQRFRGILAYDGTEYAGLQRQSNQTTIQGVVEDAIEIITGERHTIMYAGRTDAGVHARGQVMSVDLVWGHRPEDLERAINANLPSDIVLSEVMLADDDFHPRFDAISREYVYTLYVGPNRDPLRDRYQWYVGQGLNVEQMQIAADHLIGSHDFAAFGWPTTGEVTWRDMYDVACMASPDGTVEIVLEANAFLKRMVRKIVGSLVRVGWGIWTPEEFLTVFRATDRSIVSPAAPPNGLVLSAVRYLDEATELETEERETDGSSAPPLMDDEDTIRTDEEDESKDLDTQA